MARLQIGNKMPNFTFNTAYETGKTVEEALKGKQKTIFWVLRYIGCTSCRYDVHMLAKHYQEFLGLDAQIYVVMQSEAATVREDLQDARLPFDIICDTDMAIYQSLEIPAAACKEDRMPVNPKDIVKLEEKKKKIKAAGFVHGRYEGNEQQLPALFVVDQDRTVIYAHYAHNSIDMPTVEEMLEIIKTFGRA